MYEITAKWLCDREGLRDGDRIIVDGYEFVVAEECKLIRVNGKEITSKVCYSLLKAVDDPGLVQFQPRFSEDEMAVLKALWEVVPSIVIARSEDGILAWFASEEAVFDSESFKCRRLPWKMFESIGYGKSVLVANLFEEA